MPLAGYKPETREVVVGGDSFNVKGLALNEIAVLVREHFPDLEALADLFGNGIENIDSQSFQPLALSLITNAPGFVANVIALAAGEGDASDAERLPAAVQVKALFDIGELTFKDVGGPKKCLEMVAALLAKTDLKSKLSKLPTRTA